MPMIRNITVHVTTTDGMPLPEYGIQTFSKDNKVSCFIESKTDMPFHITVQPTIPFPDLTQPGDAVSPHPRDPLNPTTHDDSIPPHALQLPSSTTNPPVPFDLLASLYLDGGTKPEKQILCYLSPQHPSHEPTVILKNRYLLDATNRIRAVGWKFQDVGIEDLLGVLGIEDAGFVPVGQEEELAEMFGWLGQGSMREREEGRRGRIEVVVERVRVGETRAGDWRPDARVGGEGTAVGVGGESLRGVAHKVARGAMGEEEVVSVDSVAFEKVEPGVEFARFGFMYKGREQLGRLLGGGFAGVGKGGGLGVTVKGKEARERLVGSVGRGRKRDDSEAGEEERKGKEGRWEGKGGEDEDEEL